MLLQLRDVKPKIAFPGCWGFFGGSIDVGETPEATARRELLEELNYSPEVLMRLSTDRLSTLGNLVSHSYYCPLNLSPGKLVLRESLDLGLFSLGQVRSKELYSNRLKRSFPVTGDAYIVDTIVRLFNILATTGKEFGHTAFPE